MPDDKIEKIGESGTDNASETPQSGSEGKPPDAAEKTDQTPPEKGEAVSKADHDKLQAELTKLREESQQHVKEAEETARYWHERARGTDEPDDDKKGKGKSKSDDLSESAVEGFIEDVNKRGPTAIKDLVSKMGFVSKDDVGEMVDERAQALVHESELLKTYPDLGEKDSDFFKQTAKEYSALGDSVPSSQRMQIAAERTELKLRREGKFGPAKGEETEEERVARVKAQSGGSRAELETEPADAPLTDLEKRIAEEMGVTTENFRKRKKEQLEKRPTARRA